MVTCDHAANRVPSEVGNGVLGLPPDDMARHIAWDVGAWGVAQHLGDLLDGPVIGANFSRLVIDPNRGEDDPTLIMRLYDGTIIPANRHIDQVEVERRLELFHRPYHQSLAEFAARPRSVLLSIHSFTRQLRGRGRRPWDLGVLYASDDRLARPLLRRLSELDGVTTGDNEPYHGALRGDAMDRHGLTPGRPHVLIEICNDLIETSQGQRAWAERLVRPLQQALTDTAL